jgi:hypothetical protein
MVADLYLCRCDCGNEQIRSAHTLKPKTVGANGGAKSCGCLAHPKLPAGQASFNHLYAEYRITAKRKHREFSLSKVEFGKLTKQNCHYCGAPPQQLTCPKKMNGRYVYNGVDRLDSTIGYSKENCVAACGICNRMKMKQTYQEFIDHVKQIAKHLAGG